MSQQVKVEVSEFVAWAKTYAGPKFNAVLCDPPYALAFMGKEFDTFRDGQHYQDWTTEWASALLPLLHPGALIFCFGGTRTWHRLACGLEAAGFEMWDTLMWLHGQGFPKAQAIDKLIGKSVTTGEAISYAGSWSGHKTAALKPAWEPVLCFKAPNLGKTYAELALEHGSGALNVDGGRIGVESIPSNQWSDGAKPFGGGAGHPYQQTQNAGRYPANLALDEEAGKLLDEQAGDDKGQLAGVTGKQASRTGEHGIYGHYEAKSFPEPRDGLGGPSRFFYQSKASRSEREAGCESLSCGKGCKDGRHIHTDHPTMKPIVLCRWLATLLLPPDSVKPRRLLVPFAGSGSEGIGALQAGWDEIVGVEQDSHYAEIARARLTFWESEIADQLEKEAAESSRQLPLL